VGDCSETLVRLGPIARRFNGVPFAKNKIQPSMSQNIQTAPFGPPSPRIIISYKRDEPDHFALNLSPLL